MKKLIKNNLKVFMSIIITAVLFTGIGVYAANTYFAHDIGFTPTNDNFKKENGETITNVEDALNELYNNYSSYPKELNILLTGASESSTNYGQSQIFLNQYSNVYTKFKLKFSSKNSTVKTCNAAIHRLSDDSYPLIIENTEYLIMKDTDVFFINVLSNNNGSYAGCTYKVTLYN